MIGRYGSIDFLCALLGFWLELFLGFKGLVGSDYVTSFKTSRTITWSCMHRIDTSFYLLSNGENRFSWIYLVHICQIACLSSLIHPSFIIWHILKLLILLCSYLTVIVEKEYPYEIAPGKCKTGSFLSFKCCKILSGQQIIKDSTVHSADDMGLINTSWSFLVPFWLYIDEW